MSTSTVNGGRQNLPRILRSTRFYTGPTVDLSNAPVNTAVVNLVTSPVPGQPSAGTGTVVELRRPDVQALSFAGTIWQGQVMGRSVWLRERLIALAERKAPADRVARIADVLDAVDVLATTPQGPLRRWRGGDVERAWALVHSAEALMVGLNSDLAGFRGRLSSAVDHLPDKDPRRNVADCIGRTDAGDCPEEMGATLQASLTAADAAHARTHSFRNVVLLAGVVLWAGVILLGVLGLVAGNDFPLCGASPCGGIALSVPLVLPVMLVGSIAGMITGVVALRNLSGTSAPFQVPVALLLLKVPAGALTAVAALLMIGVIALDGIPTPKDVAGVLGVAVFFGAAQEVFTHWVDRHAATLLGAARPAG